MYLTYSEYKDLIGGLVVEDSFNKLLPKAVIQIDTVTNYFYGMPDSPSLDDETVSEYKWINGRAKAFKRALCMIIDYMDRNSVVDRSDLKDGAYSSIEIGRTHLQSASGSGSTSTSSGYAVPDEAMDLLGRFGLRYRGVASG